MKFDVVFIGTAPFGIPVLESLSERSRVNLQAVISQPDRKRGRGQESQSPPVIDRARDLSIDTFQPDDINESGIEIYRKFENIDLAIVIAYGQILNREIYDFPELGSFNFHASLLPRWRGAAPIRHSLLEGDDKTGITIFKIGDELDAGPVCGRLETEIETGETYGELYERLSKLNIQALDNLLNDLENDVLSFEEQKGEACYASKIDKTDRKIDWRMEAVDIKNQIRAYCPDPGAHTFLKDKRFTIYDSRIFHPVQNQTPERKPGTIIELTSKSIIVQAGNGLISIQEIQPAGSRRMDVESFLRGDPNIEVGDLFGSG